MTGLAKPVHRTTSAVRHEKGKTRKVIVSLSPPASIGFRLQGTQQTFWIDAEVGYEVAVRSFLRDVEKEARKIKKEEGSKTMASARAKARKRLRNQLTS